MIFSLERVLSGGTKLTLELANKLEKPVFHLYDTRKEPISKQDSLRLEIQALTDFLCSNEIEILNVAGPGTGVFSRANSVDHKAERED